MLLLIWNKCSCNSFEEYCEIDHAAFHKTAMLSYFAELSFKVHSQVMLGQVRFYTRQ